MNSQGVHMDARAQWAGHWVDCAKIGDTARSSPRPARDKPPRSPSSNVIQRPSASTRGGTPDSRADHVEDSTDNDGVYMPTSKQESGGQKSGHAQVLKVRAQTTSPVLLRTSPYVQHQTVMDCNFSQNTAEYSPHVKADVVMADSHSPWRTKDDLNRRAAHLVKENWREGEARDAVSSQPNVRTRESYLPAENDADTLPKGKAYMARLEVVEKERDFLQRAVQQLEEALRLRNDEIKGLIQRTQDLEASMLHWEAAASAGALASGLTSAEASSHSKLIAGQTRSPKWEERLMKSENWEHDIMCQWITAILQNVQALEVWLTDMTRTLRLKFQGEASLTRQIRVLNGRLLESERVYNVEKAQMNSVLEQCEVLGSAHRQILENELREVRCSNVFSENTYSALQGILTRVQQQDADAQEDKQTASLVSAMHACSREALKPGILNGFKSVLDQAGHALASAWIAIQERDMKMNVLQTMIKQANVSIDRNMASYKDKESEVRRLQEVLRQKEVLLNAWMQRYESEIRRLNADHQETETVLRQEIEIMRANASRGSQGHAACSLIPQPGQLVSIDSHVESSQQSTLPSTRTRPPTPPRGVRVSHGHSTSAPSSRNPSPAHSRSPAPSEPIRTPPGVPGTNSKVPEAVESMRQQNQQLETLLLGLPRAQEGNQCVRTGRHGSSNWSKALSDQLESLSLAQRRIEAEVKEARMLEQLYVRHLNDASVPRPSTPDDMSVQTATEPQSTVLRPRVGASPRRGRPPRGVA